MKHLALAMTLLFVSVLGAEQWSAPIQKKPLGTHGKANVNIPIHAKLDFAACKMKVNGQPHLVVRLRNGKHKMGDSSIQLKSLTSPASIRVGRIDIAKPMSLIAGKEDGAHLFDTFIEHGKTYEIFYHIKNGKLEPNVTASVKEEE